MNPLAIKRLQKELQQLQAHPDQSITLTADASDIKSWKGTLVAPDDSYYAGYEFDIKIAVSPQYPLSPPIITFVTPTFHPNVEFSSGQLCLDILKKEWSPAWNLQSACRAIILLLSEPAHDSPLNVDAGNMLRAGDTLAYRSMVRMYCEEHARPHCPQEQSGCASAARGISRN